MTTSTVAAAVGEQFGDAGGVMETDLVDHDHRTVGETEPSSTSRTSTIRSASPGAHQGRAAPAPVATITRSGRSRATSVASTADAVADLDPEPATLDQLIANEIAELGPVRDRRREPNLSARLRRSFSNTVTR